MVTKIFINYYYYCFTTASNTFSVSKIVGIFPRHTSNYAVFFVVVVIEISNNFSTKKIKLLFARIRVSFCSRRFSGVRLPRARGKHGLRSESFFVCNDAVIT